MKAADHVRADISEDGLVLLDIANGQIFTANMIAARIWQGIVVDHKPKAEIVASIVQDWQGTPDVVTADLDEFIDKLKQRQFVIEA